MDERELEEHNARRFVWANGLQNVGDQIISPKSVLPWLFTAAGVPAALSALLVPIRESGSMLPQAAITPWVKAQRSRVHAWILGALGQAAGAAGIAAAAAALRGTALGVVVLVCLAVLALSRSVCSISSKDVQGRTVSKGRRGRVTGRATELGGLVALIGGLALGLAGSDLPVWAIAVLSGVAALAWVVAARVFAGVADPSTSIDDAPADETSAGKGGVDWHFFSSCARLFAADRQFRTFVIVRTLMLVTALSTTFLVLLAGEAGTDLTGLGAFVTASGLAALIGGRVSGWLSDISSRTVMSYGSAIAAGILLAVVAVDHWAPDGLLAWVAPVAFFAVTLVHTGIRVARKTYVVDMAEGDRRTEYVAGANTLMGVALLAVGAVSAGVAALGADAALVFLAVLGLAGTVGAHRLREVSAH